jgi:hypothetical protein
MVQESWLFLGNPGVGKSTLLNCLVQRAVFPSGVSYGGGLTMDVQTCVDYQRDIAYTDTPGLADCMAGRVAADAVTRALRSGGPRMKLCFVVQLQYGRVMSQDLVTMERVLDSIHMPVVPFGIIVNCVSADACKTLSSDGTAFRRVVALVNSGKYTTPHVLLVPEFPALVDEDNKFVELPPIVRDQIDEIPTAYVPHDAICAICVANFESCVETHQRTMSMLEKDESAMAKAQEDLTKTKRGFWTTAAKGMLVLGKIILVLVVFV